MPNEIGRSSHPVDDEIDGLMIFDGLCNFCAANVRIVLKADKMGAIRFASLQSPYGRQLAERFGLDADDPSTFLFIERGRAHAASDAALAVAARLPPPWRWLRVLRFVPRGLRDAVYGFVARHRYRIAGRRETCMVPTAEQRARFLDQPPVSDRLGGLSTAKRPE